MSNTILEYVWLDSNNNFRSKCRVMDLKPLFTINDLPLWNYDGSSTGQAETTNSEIFLKPVALFKNPLFIANANNNSFLVWCDNVTIDGEPIKNGSKRSYAKDILDKHIDKEPWFGIEQEYFIVDPNTGLPLNFNENMEKQGSYYCGCGPKYAIGREISNKHLEYCLYAGIKICGTNGEVAPAQWEYQIGICNSIEAGDHLWMSRFILNRVAELYNYEISYHPKPLGVDRDWNGSGCHTNFSTKEMRSENGLTFIYDAINKLSKNHEKHIKNYGLYNNLRLSGHHETSSMNEFSYGNGNRGSSVRIPNTVIKEKCGYFEDRRPASNCDPYLVIGLLADTCLTINDNNENNITFFM